MSDSAAGKNFGAYLTVTVGLLVLALSGACTLTVGASTSHPPSPGEFSGPVMLPIAFMFGAPPMGAGAALAARGLEAFQDRGLVRLARQILLWFVVALGGGFTLIWILGAIATAPGGGPLAVIFPGVFAAAGAWATFAAARAALKRGRSPP